MSDAINHLETSKEVNAFNFGKFGTATERAKNELESKKLKVVLAEAKKIKEESSDHLVKDNIEGFPDLKKELSTALTRFEEIEGELQSCNMIEEQFDEMWLAYKSEMKTTFENMNEKLKTSKIQGKIQAVKNELSARWGKLHSLYPKSEELECQVRSPII